MSLKHKKELLIALTVATALTGVLFVYNTNKTTINNNNHMTQAANKDSVPKGTAIDFLREIAGVNANNIKITKTPVGVSGTFSAPQDSILNGANYFLKQTDNQKLHNLSITIEDDHIKGRVEYSLSDSIKTPIEVSIRPTLTKNKDIFLEIVELKLLDLKIADSIIDFGIKTFAKDLFPEDKGILVKIGKKGIVVDKKNFKEVSINKITLESNSLNLDVFINLEELAKK